MKHRRNTENGPERKDKEVYTLLHGTILSYTLRHHLRGTPNVSVYLATIHRRKTITSPSKEKNDYTTMRIVRCASVFGKATLIHIAADGIDDSRTTDGRKEARDRAKQTKPAVSLAGTREWDVPSCTNSDAKKKKKKERKARSRYYVCPYAARLHHYSSGVITQRRTQSSKRKNEHE